MSDREPAIRVQGLTRRFGDLLAVDGIEFDVEAGELFGIVGPDGAGKTTTLRMLAGVLRPSAGDARLFGASVAQDPESVKRELAYMPQRFGLYTDLTVLENIHFYADLYEVPRAERASRLERLWEFSNLKPFRDRLAGQLSGGMKQKLALSCALVHHPRLLLLDEPTFGVDPISRRDLWLIVHGMVAEGVTVVASTAYLDEAERFDRLVLLDRGRILSRGTPSELRAGLHVELLALLLDRPRDAERFLRELSIVRSASLFGERVHVGLASIDRDWPEVECALAGAGFAVHDAARRDASLEDVFLERVGASP
jgi:ABC-2 type transport system ATP-binding protein